MITPWEINELASRLSRRLWESLSRDKCLMPDMTQDDMARGLAGMDSTARRELLATFPTEIIPDRNPHEGIKLHD